MNKKSTNNNNSPLLDVQEAAEYLGVNPGTIRRWARDKQLKAVKVGTRGDWRFTKEALSLMVVPQGKLDTKGASQRTFDMKNPMQAEQRIEVLISSIDDHLVTYDRKWRFTFVNDAAASVLGKTREELLGKSIWEVFPDAIGNQYYQELHEAVRTKRPIRSEHYYAPFKKWFENHIYPFDEGVTVFATDITERKRTEASLHVSEERFRVVVENSSDLISVINIHDGTYIYVSPSHEQILGYKPISMIGKNAFDLDLFHPDDLPLLKVNMAQVKKGKPGEALEFRLKHKNGNWIIVEGGRKAVVDKKGKPYLIIAVARDVTQRRLDEEELRKNEEELRASKEQLTLITDALPVLISYVDKDERYQFNNKAYEDWFGHPRTQVYGKKLQEVLGSKAYQEIRPYVKKVLEGKKVSYEAFIPYKDGGNRYIMATYIPDFGKGKKVTGFYALVNDLTDRKITEEALSQSEASLAAAQRLAKVGSWEFDLLLTDGDINKNELRWSDECFRVFGFKPGEVRVTNDFFFSLVHPDDHELIKKSVADAIKNKKEYSIEHRVILRDGNQRIIHEVGRAVFDKNGIPIKMIGTAQDITEQKKAEESLQRSELRFKTLTDSAPVGIFETDANGDCLYVNDRWCDIAGMTPKQARGQGWVKALHPEDKDRVFREWYAATKRKKEFVSEYRFMTSKGKVTWLHGTGLALTRNGKVTGYIGTISDITDQKLSREKLEYYASLSQSISDAVVSTDKKYLIKSWNKGAEALYGWKEKDVLGKPSYEVIPTQYLPDTRRADVEESLRNNGYWQGEVIQEKKNGELVHILAVLSLIKDSKGNPVGIVAVNRDITDRKKLEQQKDEFISIASHELKTPVTSLKAYAQVVQTMLKKRGDTQTVVHLGKMDAQLNKLTNLIGDLLDVTKIEAGKLQFNIHSFDFDELVSETVETMQFTTKKHKLILRGKTGKKVFADKDRVGQVITNFLSNAIKYSPYADKIIIETQVEKNEVMLCVQDFGLGISKEEQEKVFERFFRVSGPNAHTFSGLGLGLYISSEIIKRLRGRIWVESTKGKGSSFYFSLPLKKRHITQEKRSKKSNKKYPA